MTKTNARKRSYQWPEGTENYNLKDNPAKQIQKETQRIFREKMKNDIAKGIASAEKMQMGISKDISKKIAKASLETPFEKRIGSLLKGKKTLAIPLNTKTKLALTAAGILGSGALGYKAFEND